VRPIGVAPGAASLHLVGGVALLRPEEQVFSAMLTGFANQQLARNLARSTVEGRENTVRAFANYVRERRRLQDQSTSVVVGFCACATASPGQRVQLVVIERRADLVPVAASTTRPAATPIGRCTGSSRRPRCCASGR
jgi:hypothetical protein